MGSGCSDLTTYLIVRPAAGCETTIPIVPGLLAGRAGFEAPLALPLERICPLASLFTSCLEGFLSQARDLCPTPNTTHKLGS